MKKKTDKPDIGPAEKFAEEILAVCHRWWEESDLDESTMYAFGEAALKAFSEAQIEFTPDFDLDDLDEEGEGAE